MSRATRRLNNLGKPSRPAPKPRTARPRSSSSSRGPRGPRGGWAAGLTAAGITLAIVAVFVIGASVLAYKLPGPAARHGNVTAVFLRKGARVPEIAGVLRQAGVIRSELLFEAAAQLTGGARKLKAGEYAFPSHASVSAVLARIRSGKIVHHRITVPEGLTSQQVVDILDRAPVLVGAVPTPPEGALLPETYEVVRGEQRSAVLQRMMDARDRLLVQLWMHRKPGLPYTSVGQAVTLASIVERETALAAERPRVAAVYLNRLRQGVKLDADPTVAYGLNPGRPLGRPLSTADLAKDTPYNTYMHLGLPPTPIGNPGRASLAAVMDPPSTNELYFVANGTGGHAFAATLEEQNRNVAKWRGIERERAQAAAQQAIRDTAVPAPVTRPKSLEHR